MIAFAFGAVGRLLVALVELAAAVVGLAATVAAEIARIATAMLHALAGISEALAKVALVAVLVVVVTWSFPIVWRAYGGDVAALLPASVATLLPVAYATTFKPIWSGCVFAVVAAALAGAILPALHPIALALIAGGARAAGVLHVLDTTPGPKPQEEEHGRQG